MSVRYRESSARAVAGTRHIDVRLSPDAPLDGYALGAQIYDADTEALLAEPHRQPLDAAAIALDLPPETGRYRIFISPIHDQRGWLYNEGEPFLLVDATVVDGTATIDRAGSATLRTLTRERCGRNIIRAFTLPVRAIEGNLSLIRAMVRRDVIGRYRGSFGGALWTVLTPLLLMITYFFVFGVVLETRFANDPSRSGFALYFLAGMLPWLAFSEAAGRAPSVLLEHRNFVKKLVFPVEILPVTLTAAGLVTQLIALALFLIALAAARQSIPVTALWLPALIVPQVLFTLGATWFLAAAGVFLRDLGQMIGFLLTLWFFLTPICYPESSLPPASIPILAQNPIFQLVRMFRAVLLDGAAPDLGALAKLWVLAIVTFIAGHAFFHKLRRSFADAA